MYVPVWLAVIILAVLVGVVHHFYKLYRKWEALAVNSHRRWGKMKYEYECISDLLILDRDYLCQHLEPELRKELAKDSRVKWLNNPEYWDKLSRNNQLFGPYPEYEEIRKLVYKHFQEYKYRDVNEELSNCGVKMERYSLDRR